MLITTSLGIRRMRSRSRLRAPKALLRPVILGGKVVEEPQATSEIRDYCSGARSRVSAGHRVEYSRTLLSSRGTAPE